MTRSLHLHRALALGALAFGLVPAAAWAQRGECLDPTAGLALVGAVTDFPVPPSPHCRAPVYDSSLGPIVDYAALERQARGELPTSTTATPTAVPAAPRGPALGAGEGLDLYDLEAGTQPTEATDYTDRQLFSLGRLDGEQGRPVDPKQAGSLDYMRGYTHGLEGRARLNLRVR